MAGLKIFVSSTCADLDAYRLQIRGLLNRMGYEPIMSDHSEILYDPTIHTHTSCLRDVQNADLVILLVGSRLGGLTNAQALSVIDFDQATKSSSSNNILKEKDKISVTQAEIIQAINSDVPIFAFVDSRVYADHHVYIANKSNENISSFKFPSIAKQETAKGIFEFINFISHRSFNNSITTFQSFSEIENHLLKQWSLLFQRLLNERKEKSNDNKQSIDILGKIDELKSAMLQAVPKGRERDVARAVVKYRRLVDFSNRLIQSIREIDLSTYSKSYKNLLSDLDVVDIIWDDHKYSPYYAIMILKDGGFVGSFGYTDDEIKEFSNDWNLFTRLAKEIREAVIDAAGDLSDESRLFERHSESLKEYHEKIDIERGEQSNDIVRRRVRRRPIE